MPRLGKCGLCLREKGLQNSHLLPAAIYRQLRGSSSGSDPNPVIITSSRALTSSMQVSSHFLCRDCDARFSMQGENYVVTQCARGNGSFKLRELLQNASPLGVDEISRTAVYDVQHLLGSNVDQYVYFAASVFWRASAHKWSMGGERIRQISLGEKYQEQFRLYLLGQAAFPENARVYVHISSETQAPLTVATVPTTFRMGKAHRHKFCIPGVLFILFLGSEVPKTFDDFALNGNKQRIMWICQWQKDSLLRGILKRMESAIPTGKLRR